MKRWQYCFVAVASLVVIVALVVFFAIRKNDGHFGHLVDVYSVMQSDKRVSDLLGRLRDNSTVDANVANQNSRDDENKVDNNDAVSDGFWWQRQSVEDLLPWVMYKTGPLREDDPDMRHHRDKWALLDIPVKYFDDDQCREFISRNFDCIVVDAYDRLIPGAYKADMFRYCILYVCGGVYSDLSHEYSGPVVDLVDRSADLNVVLDRVRVDKIEFLPIQIGFLACKPGIAIMKRAIDTIVKHVAGEYYGSSSLDVTGPRMFGRLLQTHTGIATTVRMYQGDDRFIYRFDTRAVAVKLHGKRHRDILNPELQYFKLWSRRSVYKTKTTA